MGCTSLIRGSMHGPWTIMHAWAWPEQQNASPVTAKGDLLRCKAVLAVTITAKGIIPTVTRRY